MKRIAIIANFEKETAAAAVAQIRSWAGAHGVEAVEAEGAGNGDAENHRLQFDAAGLRRSRDSIAGCDVAVTLGGDGTLLYGAHLAAPLGIPVLAVNLGSLGFHTQVEPGSLLAGLEAVHRGDFRIEPRLMLEGSFESGGGDPPGPERALALNDFVISKSAWGRMVRLRITVDGQQASDLFADGLLVATPTGSSAYNYAAHGPVLKPGLEAVVLNAICPHRMRFSPLVLPPTAVIEIEFHPRRPREEAQLFADGQAWCAVADPHRLKISRAPLYLPLIVFQDDFFSKLRDKLSWGGLL